MSIAARYRQQAFHHLMRATADAGIGNDRENLVDERLQAEVGSQARQGEAYMAAFAHQLHQHASNGALARAPRPYQQKHLLETLLAGNDVAEDLLQAIDG